MKDLEKSKHLCIGLLAHVDAGKTTLSEAMLYISGNIRTFGRVDNGDAFLDNYALERERGITIFSKQAKLNLDEINVTLLDTPGHVDFSAEMERTLQVLDYAILVISGTDGVQGHTKTLWKLLNRYQIPTFIFVNKMDRPDVDKTLIIKQLKEKLSDKCIEFDSENSDAWSDEKKENISLYDEDVIEKYLETGKVDLEDIRRMIGERKIFPCYFGSALKMEGIEDFINGFKLYVNKKKYSNEFGAKVYKIARDEQGNRLTYMKITGGSLKVKEVIKDEKINQIRLYSGKKYEVVSEVHSGEVCAVLGLEHTKPGQGLGIEIDSDIPVLEPILSYKLILPEDCNKNGMLKKMKELEEEEPKLNVVWNEITKEIQVQIMGEVQIDVLKHMINERFGIEVSFGAGNIVYKETISNIVEGVGHFEPLRHYAEAHFILEPLETGSGLQFDANVSEDILDRNWQRLILTHLEEKQHKGVLTGSDITDMKITLVAGKAHLKHTEGGDFRQATYRGVRQGLMEAENILLEPFYEFRLEIPSENIGRAMTDIEKMFGKCNPPEIEGEVAVITGIAPVSTLNGYQTEITSYTKGRGRIFNVLKGYYPCHNTEEVIENIGYDALGDIENPSGSVFCAHGAGYVVPWDEVKSNMHLESVLEKSIKAKNCSEELNSGMGINISEVNKSKKNSNKDNKSVYPDDELDAIFERTYGPIKKNVNNNAKKIIYKPKEVIYKGSSGKKKQEKYLLVDGYNIIFAWDELKELAMVNLDSARDKLLDILSNYQGFVGIKLMVVFDAYKVKGFKGEQKEYNNISVVFTKEAQTADAYIERFAHDNGKKYDITVATSDGLEQIIILGQGCMLMSAREFKLEVENVEKRIGEMLDENRY
ncbi:MAG: TetM/TetW/TetO/TetS family tetracycline resistance ribosomal protection protein [Lachnospiraceae bacterium]|nr:TetM/TetW/TetO/TetS family tetracycline resistance ribosomal protection protein [Lachnospiraceae bacterium]